MKKVLIILLFSGIAPAFASVNSPEMEEIKFSQEDVLGLLDQPIKYFEGIEGQEFWTAWGFKTRLKENKKLLGRDLYLAFKPYQTSPRVWRIKVVKYLIGGNIEDAHFLCFKRHYPYCRTEEENWSLVVDEGKPNKTPEDFEISDFHIFKSEIEENRLVWLYDFFQKLRKSEKGNKISVRGITLKNWPEKEGKLSYLGEDETQTTLEHLMNPEPKTIYEDFVITRIDAGSSDLSNYGYQVYFCYPRKGGRYCSPGGLALMVKVNFVSQNEVELEIPEDDFREMARRIRILGGTIPLDPCGKGCPPKPPEDDK